MPRLHVDLARLPSMSMKELLLLWASTSGGAPPSHRSLQIRELAWRAQEQRDGGFDTQTQRLVRSAMRAAVADDARTAPSVGAGAERRAGAIRRPRKPNTSPKLPVAMRLVREWGGQRHEVTVVENGRMYRYRDRSYTSLTEVARAITGAHRSGPLFFGLASRAGDVRKRPSSNLDKGDCR